MRNQTEESLTKETQIDQRDSFLYNFNTEVNKYPEICKIISISG